MLREDVIGGVNGRNLQARAEKKVVIACAA